MIKPRKPYLITLLWLLFLLHQLSIFYGISNALFRAYMDDLLVIPIMLGTYLYLMQLKKPNFTVPITWIIMSVLVTFLHFEIFMPLISGKYTRDWMDGLMYGIGALFFIILLNKRKTVGTPLPTGLS